MHAVPIVLTLLMINAVLWLQEKSLLKERAIIQVQFQDVLMDLELMLQLRKKMDFASPVQPTAQDVIKALLTNAQHAKQISS